MTHARTRRTTDGGDAGHNLTRTMLDTLGKAIVTGRYEDRPFPTEAEIAKAHGVSRSVTREAVKMLTAKGIVSARPRQGTIVRPVAYWNLFDVDVLRWMLDRKFSIDLLIHFNQLRLGIEPEAAALAARLHDTVQMQAIDAGLQRMTDAEAGDDDPLDADIAFHVAILHAAHNPFYTQFEEVVATALRTSIRFTNTAKGRSANIPEHAAVARAIERRDGDAARTAMRRIVGDVLDLIDMAGRRPPSRQD